MNHESELTLEDVRQKINETINEMSEVELLDLSQKLHPLLQSWMPGHTNVICQLQNNAVLISVIDTIQCAGCSRRFCKKHNLKYCTHCGNKI